MELFLPNASFLCSKTQKKWREKKTKIKPSRILNEYDTKTHAHFWFLHSAISENSKYTKFVGKFTPFKMCKVSGGMLNSIVSIYTFFFCIFVLNSVEYFYKSLFSKWTTTIPKYFDAFKRSKWACIVAEN